MLVSFPCRIVAGLLVAFGAVGRAFAQEQASDSVASTAGVVLAQVTDTAGQSMPAAEIVITREGDSLTVAAGTTDARGVAQVASVQAGAYSVLARKIGYQSTRAAIQVREGDTTKVTFALEPLVVVLPELETKGDRRFSLLPRFLTRGGFIGIRLFQCLFIGIGKVDEQAVGCADNANAHEARKDAREAAKGVQHAVRRARKAHAAGRRPDPKDAILVLNTANTCNQDIPRRPRWPRPDPDVECREVFHRIPLDTLANIRAWLAAMEVPESFEAELRRRQAEAAGQLAEDRRRKMTELMAQAEANYIAGVVDETARRVDQVTKAGQSPDSTDAMIVYAAATECGQKVPTEARWCHAIFKRTSRKTLERLVRAIIAYPPSEGRDTVSTQLEEPSPQLQ